MEIMKDVQIIVKDDYGNRFFEFIYQGENMTCYDYTKRRSISQIEIDIISASELYANFQKLGFSR